MAKYTFSKGKITVEDGVYRPILNKAKDAEQAGVLLLVLQPSHLQSENATLNKESKPSQNYSQNG